MNYVTTIALTAQDEDGVISAGLVQWGDTQETALSPAQVAELNSGASVSVQHSYTYPGDYAVLFTVTDDLGASNSSPAFVHIANEAPVVALSLVSTTPGTGAVSIMPTVTDDDTGPITLSISWGDGTVTEGGVSGQTYAHTYAATNHFLVTAMATDVLGAIGMASLDVYAAITPILEIQQVVVTGRHLAMTINYNTVGAWPDFVELAVTRAHAPFTKHLVPLPNPYGNGVETLPFDVPNEWEDAYAVSLTAHFTDHPAVPGGTLSATESVTMPYPDTNSVTIDQLTNPSPSDVLLRYTATDYRATLETVTVNWGDGQTETMPPGPSMDRSHTYAAQGTYTVIVTATYTDGEPARSASEAITITVAPEVYVTAAPQGAGRTVDIWATATNPDNDFVGGTLTAQAADGVVHQLGTIAAGYQLVTVTIPDEWGKTDYTIILHADYTQHGPLTAQTTVVVAPPMSNLVSIFGGTYGLDASLAISVSDRRSTLAAVEYRWLESGDWIALATQTTEQTVTRRLPASGSYTLEARATYSDGEVASQQYSVNAYNLLPTCTVTVVSITRE
ncbi:MAG: hypothetical protein ACYC7E_04585 [Armatimonadota bacterium]